MSHPSGGDGYLPVRQSSAAPVPQNAVTHAPVTGLYGALLPAQHPLMYIGEIAVFPDGVATPLGACPLRGSRWYTEDQWVATQRTPSWAVVCAVLGFFCLTVFSLLFLLAKETVHTGIIQVTVTYGEFVYSARIPVTDLAGAQYVHDQVNHVRFLAAH
jgi:hypothetical protein